MSPVLLEDIAARFEEIAARRGTTWDTLWERRSPGRIAVAVTPGEERRAAAQEACAGLELRAASPPPPRWTPRWREGVLNDLTGLVAAMECPGDGFVGLSVDRAVHGQSQGLADLLGARVQEMPDGNFYVHRLPPDPEAVAALRPRPLEESLYWGSVEYVRYAREATAGSLPMKAPVMTGPLDTANYLLGTGVVLEWTYTEPEALKALLATLTDTIVGMLQALQQAAGGRIEPAITCCMRGGPDLCSELRAVISAETYEEFEAPYLREIGQRVGPLAVHSCGSWERTVPSACEDPNLRAMNGGSREVEVAELCRLAQGRMTLSVYRSQNCHTHLRWPDNETFWNHILETVPPAQPLELAVPEAEIPLWNRLCERYGRAESRVPEGA